MTAVKNAIVCSLAALLCWQACMAQGNPWDRLRMLEERDRVSVELHSGRTVNGRIRAWSPEGLVVLQGENKPVQLAKSDIAQVAVTGRSRAEKARFAFLATAALSGGVGGIAYATSVRGADDSGGVAAAIILAVPVISGIATGIAALFPQHKERIYIAQPGS